MTAMCNLNRAIAIFTVFLFIFSTIGCDNKDNDHSPATIDKKPYLGILQFKTTHNLADNDCVAAGDCNLKAEADEDSIQTWLENMRKNSNMAVLHWDRSIPWNIFADSPPSESMRILFYDQKMDTGLLKWVNAFRDHFALMNHGYLAVSLLHSDRNRPKEMFLNGDNTVELTGECPDMRPGTQIHVEYDDGTGLQEKTFDLETAYLNFLLYLYEKLKPDYFAIMVEANLYKRFCPDQWPGLVSLYHSLYDAVQAKISEDIPVFATMVYTDLLNYDVDVCHGGVKFETCPGSGSPPAYNTPDAEVCYPIDTSAIDDLNQGERLDILALSLYPDGLLMSVPGYDDNILYLYLADTWDETSPCQYQAIVPPFLNPFERLDQLGWTKPIAMAETSARSCRTLAWSQEGEDAFLIQPPASTFTQTFWLNLSLSKAKADKFEFYVQSFLQDYDVLGPWIVQDGVMDHTLYSLFNTWPCSGIYDTSGKPKDGVTNLWLNALEQ